MNLRDLTDGQIRTLQSICGNDYREMQKANRTLLPELELWNKAFSRGVQAAITMFEKQITGGGDGGKK